MPRPISVGADSLIDQYFPVLDHGFVAMVDYMGNDTSIEHAARISYGKGTRTRSKTEGLLRYLKRHAHTTPSEMVEIKLHCSMPIFVARQWVRHRTASLNEYSGRYSILPNVTFKPDEWRLQSKKNNQGSEATTLSDLDSSTADNFHKGLNRQIFEQYDWLEEQEVARELSRIDLPLSSYTQWYWKIDLHNLMHFLTLRCDSHAQPEIRVYGDIIAAMVKDAWPMMYNAWKDYDLEGCRLSYMERMAIRNLMNKGTECTEDALKDVGLSKREIDEFYGKFESNARTTHELGPAITAEMAFYRMFPDAEYEEDS